jgi:hypothetical protein
MLVILAGFARWKILLSKLACFAGYASCTAMLDLLPG